MTVIVRDGEAGVDDAFADLPHVVYASDAAWIPEERESLARAFSSHNPWLATGRAATLCVPGRARLAVFRDPRCRVRGAPAAFFGYWEHHGAPDAARDLLDAARDWARAAGAEALYGPVDFTTFGRYRLRLSAEPGAGSFVGEPYNPPSYPGVLAAAGLPPVQRYVTQIAAFGAPAVAAKAPARDALLDAGYTFEPLDGERWLAMLPELHQAADEIFGANFAYTPVSLAAFAASHGDAVARRLCPRTSLAARAPDGSLAGFTLVYPDYAPLVARGPAAVPASRVSFAEHAPRLAALGARTAVVKTVGVAAAHRRRGVMDAMGVTVVERGCAHYDRWIAALIRADNPSRRFGAAHPGAERHYALYGCALSGDGARDA